MAFKNQGARASVIYTPADHAAGFEEGRLVLWVDASTAIQIVDTVNGITKQIGGINTSI